MAELMPDINSAMCSYYETLLKQISHYLNESVNSFISILGDMRSYNMLYTASSIGILT